MRSRLRLSSAVLVVALATGLAACSSSAKASAPASSSTVASTAAVATPTKLAKCAPPKSPRVISATKIAGTTNDWTLSSFDGTSIRLHWFPAPTATGPHPDPTVLIGPGWGEAGDTNVSTSTNDLFGSLGIGSLHQAGYNVLTWDPRGFGKSGGTVEIDSPDYEGRDVESMFDWISTRPGVALDGPRDPRVGMAGGSYGGGIQLVTAAIDCRVDAITPMIAWHSLTTSLFKADTPKNGWSGLLNAATTGRMVDTHVAHAYAAATTTGVIGSGDRDFFASRGPGDLIKRIDVPTLVIQGTVDNLFTLDEGITNYRTLRARGVPTAMLWFCGGHGVCLTNAGDQTRVAKAVIAWLDRYVKSNPAVYTGARFEFVDQDGADYTAADYPIPAGAPVKASGTGVLHYTATGGSGPAHPAAGNKDPLAGFAAGITPARATNAANVAITFAAPAVVVGAPTLTLSYTGTTPAGVRPTRVFAQLVDDVTGIVLGNQVTPIAITLDGAPHWLTVPLEAVAFAGRARTHVSLQLVATTVAYAQPRLGGTVTFDKIDVSLPVASGLAAK